MERRVDELLNALHSLAFTDSESIIAELKNLVLRPSLSATQIAFCSTKLLNSDVSLLNFISKFRTHQDRLIWKTISNALNLVSEYVKVRSSYMGEYLHDIKETCMQLLAPSTRSNMVKEAALRPLIKLLEDFNPSRLKSTLEPENLFGVLLDNKIRFEEKTMGSILKGAIYSMLGLLVSYFETDLEPRIPELQELLYAKFKQETKKKDSERTIAGLLKGLGFGLKAFNYTENQLEEWFNYISTLIVPLSESNYVVPKAALKALSMNTGIFAEHTVRNASTLFTNLFKLVQQGPPSMKFLAQEALEGVLLVLAESLSSQFPEHLRSFQYIITVLEKQLHTPESGTLVPCIVRSIGVFSLAILEFKGEDFLKMCLERIVTLSSQYLTAEEDEADFKSLIMRQKHIVSFMASYSDIARALPVVPEQALLHFSNVALEIFKKNMTIYRKYRFMIYNSLAQLLASLYTKFDQFLPWIRLFCNRAMQEVLSTSETEDSSQKILMANKLWRGILKMECLTEGLIQAVIDEIGRFYLVMLQNLDLRYSVSGQEIVPNNPYDQKLLFEATEFAKKFLKGFKENFSAWIVPIASELSQKTQDLPMVESFYKLLGVVLKISDSVVEDQVTKRFFTQLLKQLMKRMESFYGVLLMSSLEACLSAPISIVYSSEENNLNLWVPVIQKALSLGFSHLPLAHMTLNTLNSWTEEIPMEELQKYLPELLPELSPYLSIDKVSQELQGEPDQVLQDRKKRKTVAYRVVKFLGSLGGMAHYIVGTKNKDLNLSWDTEPRVKVALPLHTSKFDTYLDPLIPRILYLAEHSTHRRIRVVACELLHSLILFMIGNNAQAGRKRDSMPFSKIYQKLFPGIYRLAAEVEPVVQQVFEPLGKQLVRWFARSRGAEHPETVALLDALMQGLCEESNAALRKISASCIAEFAKEVLSQPQVLQHFKSILRRIETFANHPHTHKRMGAVACIREILPSLSLNQELVDRFYLETGHVLFMTTKLSHYDKDSDLEVCVGAIEEYLNYFPKHLEVLVNNNQKRAYHSDFYEFLDWLWTMCGRSERNCRELAQQAIVQGLKLLGYNFSSWSSAKPVNRNFSNFEEFEGVLDLCVWCAEHGLSLDFSAYEPAIQQFLEAKVTEENIQNRLYAFKVLFRFHKTCSSAIGTDLLIGLILAPENWGLVPQVETPELTKLYRNIRDLAIEVLPPLNLSQYVTAEFLNEVSLKDERVLCLCLDSLAKLISGHTYPEVRNLISEVLEPLAIEFLSQESLPQVRKGKALLRFFTQLSLKPYTLGCLLTSLVLYQNSTEETLAYITSHWIESIPVLLRNLATKPETLLSILIAVLQSGSEKVKNKAMSLGEFVEGFTMNSASVIAPLSLLPSQEVCSGIARVYCVFLDYCKSLSLFEEGVDLVKSKKDFTSHLMDLIGSFLREEREVAIKKQGLNLLAVSWSYKDTHRWEEIKNLVEKTKTKHFLSSTLGIPSSKESYEFDQLVRAFLELVRTSGDLEALEFIYPLLREEDSGYEKEITFVISDLVDSLLIKEPRTYQEAFKHLVEQFLNPKIDTNIKNNLRWGIAKRLLLPMMDSCDESLLEALVVDHTHKFLNQLNSSKFSELSDSKEYFFNLYEKVYILLFFEKGYSRIPSSELKESTHKKLFGENSQGNELTKQLISFCNKYRKSKPERHEVIGGIQGFEQCLRDFASACYSCLLTCIRKTQSQEKVYTNFLFKDQVWSYLVEDKQFYNFAPQTNFKLLRVASKPKLAPENKLASHFISSSLFSQDFTYKPPKEEIPEETTEDELELDEFNSLTVMRPLLSAIDRLQQLFSESWFDMPQWMQCLHSEICNPSNNLSVKLLIIKVVLNRPEVFKKWSDQWFEPIARVMSGSNGGTGFHYFLRDVCTLFLYEWEVVPNSKERTATVFVNYLIRVGADTTKAILESNLEIIGNFLKQWKSLVTLEHKYIKGMISRQKQSEEKLVIPWKILGIAVYGLAVDCQIPVLENFQPKTHELDSALVACLDFNRRQIVRMAAEVLGKRLHNNPELLQRVQEIILSNKDTTKTVAILENITKGYPCIYDCKNVALKLSGLTGTLSGVSRAGILKSVCKYSEYIKTCEDFYNLPELIEYIYRDREKIANDNEETHRLELLKLLNTIIPLSVNSSVEKAIGGFSPLIKRFCLTTNQEIRKSLYEFMQKLFDQAKHLSDKNKLRMHSRDVLLKALGDTSPELSDMIAEFWHQQERLSYNPVHRVIQCLIELYSKGSEELWLLASSHLCLKLSSLSTDYNRLMFDQPLAECEFEELEMKTSTQSSMPLTPQFSQSYSSQLTSRSKEPPSQASDFAIPKRIRIRHHIEGSQASQTQKKELLKKQQQQRITERAKEQRAKQVEVMRKYRVGELPDIQIPLSDLLGPLIWLCRLDAEIASHMWVVICSGLCLQNIDQANKIQIVKGLDRVLKSSERYDPAVISCVHRTACEIVKHNGQLAQELHSEHIANSGVKGLSYQSAIMLLQECILRYEVPVKSKRRKVTAKSGTESAKVDENTKKMWIALTRVYEEMGDTDSVKGLWMKVAPEHVIQAFDSKTRGEIKESKEMFREILEKQETDPEITKEVQKEYLEALGALGKWKEVAEATLSTHPLHIKALLRLDEFEQVENVMKTLNPSDLYNIYPYEMAVLSITQDDSDRAKYYLDEEFARFVEQWQSLHPLSDSARHKLVQKVSKIFDCTQVLKVFNLNKEETQEEFLGRLESSFLSWRNRKPSLFYDELKVWEELLYARVLFYDKLRNKHKFESPRLKDFRSVLHADTSECPLKLGYLSVADTFLRRGLNLREEAGFTHFELSSSVLRLRAKQELKNSYKYSVDKINSTFQVIIKTADSLQVEEDQAFQHLKGNLYQKLTQVYLGKLGREVSEFLPETAKAAYDHLSSSTTLNCKLKLTKFCDQLLRAHESENEEQRMVMGVCFNKMKIQPQLLAKTLVSCGLECMALGSKRAHNMFPRFLELLKYEGVAGVFSEKIEQVPAWMFIRWISQILAILDKEECNALAGAVHKLVQKYPQTVFYPYKCFMSVGSASEFYKLHYANRSQTWLVLESQCQKFSNLNCFVEALNYLTHPEHRLQQCIESIKEAVKENEAVPGYLGFLAKELHRSVVGTESPLIGNLIGSYNKKFAKDWSRVISKVFGEEASNLEYMESNQIVSGLDSILKKLRPQLQNLSHGNEKLNTFNEWLADYDITSHMSEPIQIPGLVSGINEPYEGSEVNVVSFNQNLLILGSIRRPKRLGIHGSNEKEYLVLVKGGEDLRLDQRIQQIFAIMNEIFHSDPVCGGLGLNLKTYNVVPMTKHLGILEWVKNTEPIKNLLNQELLRHYRINNITSLEGYKSRMSWLSSLGKKSASSHIQQQHIIALQASPEQIILDFNNQQELVPWDLIRQTLLGLSSTPESFLYIRKQFTLSLAAISIAGYILGIGDRHLENLLLDTQDGGILSIDFGVAFGSGVGLGVPELMPFRLTRQFVSVLNPEGPEGQLRHAMIHALKALQKHKNLILDSCEVFIKEPLLDWMKYARSKEQNIGASESYVSQEHSWFPKRKLEILRKKLEGTNSAQIMLEELQATQHSKKVKLT